MQDRSKEIGDRLASANRKWMRGDSQAALEEIEQVEKIARSDGNESWLVGILSLKADWLREMGRSSESRKALEEAEQLATRLPEGVSKALVGLLQMEKGIEASGEDLALAEQQLKEASAKLAEAGLNEIARSEILRNLASVHLKQGRYQEAQAVLLEAESLDRKTGIKPALSADLNWLGLLYVELGDRVTGERYLSEALKVATEGGCVQEAANAILSISNSLDDAGLTELARVGFESALELYKRIQSYAAVASVKCNLGILAAKEGNVQKARELFEDAHRLHLENHDVEHAVIDLINLAGLEMTEKFDQAEQALTHATEAAKEVDSHGLLGLACSAYWTVARSRAACIDTSKGSKAALQVLSGEVLPAYRKAMDAVELLRTNIRRPEEREFLLWNKEDLYGEAIRLAGTLGLAQLAFEFNERFRARAFLDVLGNARVERFAARNPLAMKRQELTAQVLDLMKQKPPDSQRIRGLVEELNLLRAEVCAKEPAIAAVTEASMPSIEAICKTIPNKTAVVEYFVDPRGHLGIFVLESKGVAAFTMLDLGQFDLSAEIKKFRAEIDYEMKDVPTGNELFEVLLHEVWDVLNPMKRLLIVPHRDLHYVPFGALWFHTKRDEKVYLAERFALSVLPSAAYLPLCLSLPRSPLKRGSAALVLGNPTGDLPFAEEEAVYIASGFGVDALLRGQARKQSVLKAPQGLYAIHISSHGQYVQEDPLLSGVILADGPLTVEDLLGSNVSTGLLTLSGCVTALSERRPGDELVGLVRAAALAGIPSVVATLWNVRDESCRYFFEGFYYGLGNGLSKDDAVAYAQKRLRESDKFSHPVHWAPFVLYGDWR